MKVLWKDTAGPFISKILVPIIQENDIQLILDCCSGSCGPSTIINYHLNQYQNKKKSEIHNDDAPTSSSNSETMDDPDTITILTDLYPQISSWKVFASKSKTILYSPDPVDATNIDQSKINRILEENKVEVNGTMKARSIFGAFHHFKRALLLLGMVQQQKDLKIL